MRAAAALFGPDPLREEAGLSRQEFEKAARAEKAGLVDPYLLNPEEYFAWEADDDFKEVRITSANRTVEAKRALECAEKYLGLNREELCKVRYRVYAKAETFKDVLGTELPKRTRARVEGQIQSMMESQSEFAGMVRFFVRLWKLSIPS
jgi:hypothetical protein